jgi:hypothetical protein
MSMNHQHAPSATCAAIAELLPILDEPELDSPAAMEAREHVRTCAYCQEQYASYARLDAALRRHIDHDLADSPDSSAAIMQVIATQEVGKETPTRLRTEERQPRSRAIGIMAVAAVVCIVVLAQLIFHQRAGIGSHPHGPQYSFPGVGGNLIGVSMVSPNEGWAIGKLTKIPLGAVPQNVVTLYHYHAGNWSAVDVTIDENFSPDDIAGIGGAISMDSASDGWAVLHNWLASSVLLHYWGGAWSQVAPDQTPPGNILSVQAISPTSVWAIVGLNADFASISHFDGTRWTSQTITGVHSDVGFSNVTALHMQSDEEGWALADLNSTSGQTVNHVLLHYANGAWNVESVFNRDPTLTFSALSIVSPADIWALGGTLTADTSASVERMLSHPVLYHFHDGAWQAADLPIAPGDDVALGRVVMTTPGDGWLVGKDNATILNDGPASITQQHTVLLHFAGGRWQRAAALPTGATNDGISDVAFMADGSAWVVGYIADITAPVSSFSQMIAQASPLILHYQHGAWTIYRQGISTGR